MGKNNIESTCLNLIHSDFPGALAHPTFLMSIGELPGSLGAVSPATELLNWHWDKLPSWFAVASV